MNCLVCGHGNPPGARFCANCGNALAAPSSGEVGRDGLIGQLVGNRYLIKRVIGEGGMGVVYEAEQRMGSEVRRVAVKTLLPALSRDPVIVSRFYRECGIVSQLEHPNTIKFFDFGETPDGTLYISMEYVRGQPLTELIAQGPIELERARHILRQVSGALYEAHTMGIVHRDLKPDNIVLNSRAGEADFVKLLDFGIAARTTKMSTSETKLTQQGMVLGTPPYMSPEQLTGEPVDARSDVYSLGVIGYEMLTGRLPFDADTPWQWAQKHMLEAPAPLRSAQGAPVAPAYVEQAVLHALAKKPEERPATALEFYAELAGERSGSTPWKVRTLDEERDRAPRTSPMPMPPGPPVTAPSLASPYAGAERTALAPEFTPAFHTGAAVSAAIPPPQLRPRRRRGLGLAAFALASVAVVGGAVAAVAYYEPFKAKPVAATSPPAASATQVAPVEVPPDLPPETPATTTPPAAPPVTTPPTKTTKTTKPPAQRDPPRTPNLPTPPQATPPAQSPPSLPTTPPVTQPPAQQPPPVSQPTIPPPPVSQPPATPPPVSEPPPATGPGGDQACFASRDAAMIGNIELAASQLRRCQATGGSARAQAAARSRISSQVATVVRQRANVGDCSGARSAAASAASVGAMQGAAALATTSCAAG
ncbi:MAG TPA: serine/threonine-protein kinase [Polyangiaceae bacterium]